MKLEASKQPSQSYKSNMVCEMYLRSCYVPIILAFSLLQVAQCHA